jgi:hypothetical protein
MIRTATDLAVPVACRTHTDPVNVVLAGALGSVAMALITVDPCATLVTVTFKHPYPTYATVFSCATVESDNTDHPCAGVISALVYGNTFW